MVTYNCEKCNKEFNLKGDYTRHINKKKDCTKIIDTLQNGENDLKITKIDIKNINNNLKIGDVKINNNIEDKKIYKCTRCDKIFARKDYLDKHNNGRCKNTVFITNMEDKYNKLLLKLEEQNNTLLQKIEEQNKVIENLIKENINKTNIKGNNNTIGDNNTINNIEIHAYNSDNLKDITDNVCNKILKDGYSSVTNLIEYIHFNKEKPEYHNLLLTNKREKTVYVYNGDIWELKNKDDVIYNLYNEGCAFIFDKYDKIKENKILDKKSIEKLERFRKDYDDDFDKLQKSRQEDIELIMYNKRDLISESKKKYKNSKK